jgi:TetR/AcrR family transcriptional repressor of mexJK operon
VSEPKPKSPKNQASKQVPPSRPPGRPRDPAKVEAVLRTSWSLFLKQGVEAVTIDQIAAEAGVAKVTIYSYFSDKRAIFQEGVRREMAKIESSQSLQDDLVKSLPLREQLVIFGTGLMYFWTSPTAIDFYSSLSGELRRDRELARLFFEAGPGRTISNLSAILSGPAAEGLALPDPRKAAEMLLGMWQGMMNYQLMLGIDIEEIRASIAHRAEESVKRFLIAYAPPPA